MLYFVFLYVIFFFQAEDGIRDLVRSRGLGDVYKRQVLAHPGPDLAGGTSRPQELRLDHDGARIGWVQVAVSYTHLTLPTIYSV